MNHIVKLLEEMGFRKVCNEWVATFEDEASEKDSDSIVDIVVKEETDEERHSIVEFHAFNKEGRFLRKYYLDQIIAATEMHLNLVPLGSNKSYRTDFHLEITVPVYMSFVPREKKLGYFKDGCLDELSIAQKVATAELNDWLEKCPFTIRGVGLDGTEEV